MNLLCQSAWDKPKFISFPWISLVERNKQTHERLPGQSIKDKQIVLPCLQHSTIHSWHNALITADESWVPLTVYMRHFPLLINNTLRHLNSVIWGSNSFSPGREQSTIFWLTLRTRLQTFPVFTGGHGLVMPTEVMPTEPYHMQIAQAKPEKAVFPFGALWDPIK